jgi:hypothetical protein
VAAAPESLRVKGVSFQSCSVDARVGDGDGRSDLDELTRVAGRIRGAMSWRLFRIVPLLIFGPRACRSPRIDRCAGDMLGAVK